MADVKINRYENYTTTVISRSTLKAYEYNPRKITAENRKKLKARIKKSGLVMPIVFNIRTGNIVSGHQRIDILDELHRGKDYQITVAQIDVDEKEEVELNIFLNNVSAMGEFDSMKLEEIKDTFPDLNFTEDLGFDDIDLAFMDYNDGVALAPQSQSEQQQKTTNELDKINADRKKYRQKVAKLDAENDGAQWTEYNDYSITFVFRNNKDKRDFLAKIGISETEKLLKYTVLYDLAKGKYKDAIYT